MNPYRDRDAYLAIVAALRSTHAFASVTLAAPHDAVSVGADRLPLALVAPAGWSEAPGADAGVAVHRATFSLILAVRDADPWRRFNTLDRLAGVARAALAGSDLGGGCVAALTRLRAGRFDPDAQHPELRAVLSGEFAYPIGPSSPPAAHP